MTSVMFLRNKFDRFGDDLCEFILGYLPLNECLSLQFVSKQFKRLIFKKQTKILISSNTLLITQKNKYYQNSYVKNLIVFEKNKLIINNKLLSYVMKNCKNINHIIIYSKYFCNETLNILSLWCNNVIKLYIYKSLSHISWYRFAKQNLQNLESLIVYNQKNDELISTLIKLCPNIKTLKTDFYNKPQIVNYFNGNIGKEINTFHGFLVEDRNFIKFTDFFKVQLKSLKITFNFNSKCNQIENFLMKNLAKFINLVYLECCFFSCDEINVFGLIKLIGLNCKFLKVLKLVNINSSLFGAFDIGFQSIEKLIFKNCNQIKSLQFLKNINSLTKLKVKIFDPNQIDFKFIHKYIKNLKYCDLCFYISINRESLFNIIMQLKEIPNLCVLNIGCICNFVDCYCGIKIDEIIFIINNCLHIRRIGIYRTFKIFDMSFIENYIYKNKKNIIIEYLNNL